MNRKSLLTVGAILLLMVVVILLTQNYFAVKKNWQKIHAIKFEQGTYIRLTTNTSNSKSTVRDYACESDCTPLEVSNVEVHLYSESMLNISFSVDGTDKNQMQVPIHSVKIDEATGVLNIIR